MSDELVKFAKDFNEEIRIVESETHNRLRGLFIESKIYNVYHSSFDNTTFPFFIKNIDKNRVR